jgi:cation diffusion facilitator CzcD-associated flavoprotein CzcO
MLNTVIVGAGPYGLSVAAYFRHRGIGFRIFGRPMDSWSSNMPKGMFLKSDGFASNIYDPEDNFTLERFCAERGIEYAHSGVPVNLDTFCAYGLAFRERMVPELEDKQVTAIERATDGFRVQLDDGEVITAGRVVLAVGITHFAYIPEPFANLPEGFVSHSFRHRDLESFKGRKVVVVGGGASATDLAGLLHEAGSDVELTSRRESLKFHTKPSGKPSSLWQRIRHPKSGLGPGWKHRFFSDAPQVFYYLPQGLRLALVRRILGPSGGWFIKDKVVGKVPLTLGSTPQRAEVVDGKVHLHVRTQDGAERAIVADHVICATGYKVNVDRLQFLSAEIRAKLAAIDRSPVLSSSFESSVPGLYFVGVSAANSFGPLMRFAYGAGFAASTVTRALAKSLARKSVSVPVADVATTAK